MVLLTDGDQTYSDHAWGGNPNLGSPTTPTPYPARPYEVGLGDGGHDTIPPPAGSCVSAHAPGDPSAPPFGFDYNEAIRSLDVLANAKATTLKQSDSSGVNIEIYVLRFANPPGDDPASVECDSALVSVFASGRDYSNDPHDRNLSRCLASNRVMGDPFAEPARANDHYFYAATAADITGKFTAIAANILRKRRLVA